MAHRTNESAPLGQSPSASMLETRLPVSSPRQHALLAPISTTCGSIIWGYVDNKFAVDLPSACICIKRCPEARRPCASGRTVISVKTCGCSHQKTAKFVFQSSEQHVRLQDLSFCREQLTLVYHPGSFAEGRKSALAAQLTFYAARMRPGRARNVGIRRGAQEHKNNTS